MKYLRLEKYSHKSLLCIGLAKTLVSADFLLESDWILIYNSNMKKEVALQVAIANPDFLAESGSRLYGTSVPTSDRDLRGFTLPPYEYLIGLANFDSQEMVDADHKIYSLKRFLELVLRGDPQCTELLFVKEEHILECSNTGKRVMALKPHLLSNAIYNRIMGYSIAEWRKAMAVRIESTFKGKDKKNIFNDIRNLWRPDKETMDAIISLLDEFDEKELVPSTAGLGKKRRKDVADFGYCRKSAAHSIRLLTQLIELMQTKSIIFPRPNAKMLLDIRNGKFSKEELEEIHEEFETKAKEAREKSLLKDKPDSEVVWQEYENIVAEFLFNDIRFRGKVKGEANS